MMNNCPVCNRRHIIKWPEFWPYRRKDLLFCSDQCRDVYDVKVLHKLNGKILPEKKKGKKTMSYTKTKKDGTPAKKSGPKPKKIEAPEDKLIKAAIEHPERPIVKVEAPVVVDKIETPEKPEKRFSLPAVCNGFEVIGIRGEYGVYRANDEVNYFDFQPFGGELCMSPEDWHEQLDELHRAAKVLGVKL